MARENLKLKKPITIGEGEAKKTIAEIDLSKLDDLTGSDINFCIREASAVKGEVVRVIVLDVDVHMQVAAKASGLSLDILNKLHAADYVELATVVQNFLTGSN